MDTSQLDALSRTLAASRTRRALSRTLAALPLLGASSLLMDEVAAKKKTFCLNGQTTTVKGRKKKLKKKVRRLRKRGATSGACPTGCTPACRQAQRCCGTTCVATLWANQTTFGTDGSGSNNFDDPRGLTLTTDSLTALIADVDNHRVSVWTRPSPTSPDWTNQTTFGAQGTDPDSFDAPRDVAITPDSLTALIADTFNNRISIWTRPNATSPDWSNLTTFGTTGAGANDLDDPRGLTLTSDGLTVLIADAFNHRISVWTRPSPTSPAWSNQTTFGVQGTNANAFDLPESVAITPDGLTALIADTGNHRISVWTRPNATSPTWTNQARFGSLGSGVSNFDDPRGVAVTPDGLTAVIADADNDRVSVWARPNSSSLDWSNVTTFGTLGLGANNFDEPRGVVITPDGMTALIADNNNSRVSVWALTCPA